MEDVGGVSRVANDEDDEAEDARVKLAAENDEVGRRGRGKGVRLGNGAAGPRLSFMGTARKHFRHSPASGRPKMAASLLPEAAKR